MYTYLYKCADVHTICVPAGNTHTISCTHTLLTCHEWNLQSIMTI